ncbi:MAG: type VI secretion system tube protein Hcp [Pseudomonadota bacterium]
MKHRLAASWITASTLCLAAAPALAADYYLEIPDIDGGSVVEMFDDQIEVLSFSWNVLNAVQAGSGGGGSTSKAVFGDLHWTQALNQSIPGLFAGVASGRAFDEVVLSFVEQGEEQSYLFFTMTFEDVVLTSLSLSGASGGDPLASLSLSYTGIGLAYIPQDKDGKLLAPIKANWDLDGVKGDARVLMQLASPEAPIVLDVSQPIPEPEQSALLLAGLGLIGWVARRRRLQFG